MGTSETCVECGKPCRRHFWTFWASGAHECQGDACDAKLCASCFDKHPLLLGESVQEASIHKFCTQCFRNASNLDFSRTFDVMEGQSGITFVYAHGGCGSRAMFQAHAQELNKRFRHKQVLFDLPGHGTLVNVPLTLESCKDTLARVLEETTVDGTTIFVGGSLGAYVGFYLCHEFRNKFSGAILIDCGQNVGPGASIKARMGLVMLSAMGNMCSNTTLLQMMADVSKKSNADYKLMETCFEAGMYFDQVQAQVECLRAVAPAEYIPMLDIPILFMNGSKDYRDSEDKWLSLCKDSKRSSLKVYEDGDHFFTHEKRFVEDILERMHAFATSATDGA